MLNLRRFVAAALVVTLAIGLSTLNTGQAQDSSTSEGSAQNDAIFVETSADFDTGTAVTASDIENGATSLGQATFNVDSTATFGTSTITLDSGSGTTSAPAGAAFTDTNTAQTACQISSDGGTNFNNGDVALTTTGNSASSGSGGTDFNIDLQIDWTQYSDAPSGTYTCEVELTATEE